MIPQLEKKALGELEKIAPKPTASRPAESRDGEQKQKNTVPPYGINKKVSVFPRMIITVQGIRSPLHPVPVGNQGKVDFRPAHLTPLPANLTRRKKAAITI